MFIQKRFILKKDLREDILHCQIHPFWDISSHLDIGNKQMIHQKNKIQQDKVTQLRYWYQDSVFQQGKLYNIEHPRLSNFLTS